MQEHLRRNRRKQSRRLRKQKLRQQKQTVLKKQQELKRIEKKIDHRLNWLTDAENMPLNIVSLIQLPACRVVWMDDPLKVDGSADMEAPIRKLDQSDAEAVVFLGKVGLGISAETRRKRPTAAKWSTLSEIRCARAAGHGGRASTGR